MSRYRVVEGSATSHCCFEATVVDTSTGVTKFDKGRNACECLDKEDAQRIADALNKADVARGVPGG